MNNYAYVAMLVFFMMSVLMANAAESSNTSGNPVVKIDNSDILALEKEWASTHRTDYFHKAYELIRTRKNIRSELIRTGKVMQDKNSEFQNAQLDLASGVLMKSRCGTEFGLNDCHPLRWNQAEIISLLADTNIWELKSLPGWMELRARYVRLMMYQRAAWISLRDPSLDDKGIELNSIIQEQPETESVRQERLLRNQRNIQVALQYDLRNFLKERGPAIDRFMVAAFSIEPIDLRMLNESLAMGLYTPEERIKIVNTVEAATDKKLPLGQLPDKIVTQPASATPKVDGEKKP